MHAERSNLQGQYNLGWSQGVIDSFRSYPDPEEKGIFRKSSTPGAVPGPPTFQVDARLPNPTIITCNEQLPLRILVQKVRESTETIFLSMLHVELIGYTHVRAHDLNRSESRSWVIMSQSNMNIPLGEPSDPVGKEWNVPSRCWENIPLPNTVAPSFETCNISRTYEIEVRVGLSHGIGIESIKPEIIVLPLRLAVSVYSGIAPPPALLQKMATSRFEPSGGGATPLSPASVHPPTPITSSYAQPPGLAGTTPSYSQAPRSSQPPDGVGYDEAPPSYEDAMADEIAPVDGPRRDYSVPAPPDRTDSRFGADSKGGTSSGGGAGHNGSSTSGLGRRVSERLFPQTGASATLGRGSGNGNASHSRQSSTGDGDSGAHAVSAADNTAGQAAQPPQLPVRKPTLPPSFEESSNNDS